MENLFEKIPHAQQVQNGMNQAVQEKLQAFLTRIVRVMETMDTKTVTIPAQGDGILLCGLHAERIKGEFRRRGWEIMHYSDQRDGEYFTLKMITPADEARDYWNK